MKIKQLKSFVLLLGLMLPTAWCGANGTCSTDGHSHIQVKEARVENTPKGHTIKASIDGHTLTVLFTENLGQVDVEMCYCLDSYLGLAYDYIDDGLYVHEFPVNWTVTPLYLYKKYSYYIYHELYVEFGRPYAVN